MMIGLQLWILTFREAIRWDESARYDMHGWIPGRNKWCGRERKTHTLTVKLGGEEEHAGYEVGVFGVILGWFSGRAKNQAG